MKFRPARSSGPSDGAVGVLVEQHDGCMMFAVPNSEWPRPIVWPISCSSTRAKFVDCLKEDDRSAAF